MHIKKQDTVLVIAGKDAGKKGKVVRVLPREEKIVVEGANRLIRHVRPRRQGEKGQKLEVFVPLTVGKVILVCPKCNKPARVGTKRSADGKVMRVCRKCKESF